LGLVSKSNSLAAKFSATRLPTTSGDVPRGHWLKIGCPGVVRQPAVATNNPAAANDAILLGMEVVSICWHY
jgi:hypothetical protein